MMQNKGVKGKILAKIGLNFLKDFFYIFAWFQKSIKFFIINFLILNRINFNISQVERLRAKKKIIKMFSTIKKFSKNARLLYFFSSKPYAKKYSFPEKDIGL